MNKQQAKTSRGIEWTDYTWNAIAGCNHGCRWTMPDGTIAICYAEDQAESERLRPFYPQGFASHYWHPHRLNEPLKVKKPAKIFLDSMSDLMGAWTPAEQVEQVLGIVRQAHWHKFQLLTKNAPKLLEFDLPTHLWAGVSSPPDFMFGKQLTRQQQERMLAKSLDVLSRVNTPIRWMSFEPLSWDVSAIVRDHPPLQWAVIGAATDGPRHYQPNPAHVQALLDVLDSQNVPVFFKGNLRWSPWREEFP